MLAMVDDSKGFMAQKEGRLMKYQILENNKIISTPLHFEKDCEIYDMLYLQTFKLLLVYCHNTLPDKTLSKKSKIISFNLNNKDPTPSVYLSNFQAPANRGKIMKTNKDETFLYLAECENSGSHSNCHLRVLGGLGTS